MRHHWKLVVCLAASSVALAGPIEFGRQEFERALAERKLPPNRFRIQTEVSADAPESFRIVGARISGGDVRGLMYGLLEAASQIRATGRLTAAKAVAGIRIRGVRLSLHPADTQAEWFRSRTYWEDLFAALARNRFNRLNLAFGERVVISQADRESLARISEAASGYAVDLVLSLYPESLDRVDLKSVLAVCPNLRSVGLKMGFGGANKRDALVRSVAEAGRRVVAETPAGEVTPGLTGEIIDGGVPWRVMAPYTGRPPSVTGGAQEVLWELAENGPRGGDSWSEPADVRRFVQEMTAAGAAGFEIQVSPAASGETGNWNHALLGQLSYDLKPAATQVAAKQAKKR